jgi:hypothetical protein
LAVGDDQQRWGGDPLAQLVAPPLFVVGHARSGTSWVLDIFRAHPLVCGVFESMIFERGNGMVGLLGGAHWGGDRPHGLAELMTRDEAVAEVRRAASRLLAKRLQPHHRYLVEKTPAHAQRIAEIAEVFPGSQFVHVVRDGRDVWVSAREARRSWARSWRTLPAGLEVARTAHRWQATLEAVRAQAAAVGHDRVLEVRYEALRADPKAGYRGLFDFAGIPYDDDVLDHIYAQTDFDVSGRAGDPSGFYRAGRVGDWRGGIGLVEGLVFNAFGGSGLVDAGYERDRRWLPPLRREKRSAARS